MVTIATADAVKISFSLLRRREGLSQANVRSPNQRHGNFSRAMRFESFRNIGFQRITFFEILNESAVISGTNTEALEAGRCRQAGSAAGMLALVS